MRWNRTPYNAGLLATAYYIIKAVAIDTNLLVVIRATNLLLTPIQSCVNYSLHSTHVFWNGCTTGCCWENFDTIEEVENTLKLLEKDYYHHLRWFNSHTMSEYNRLREKAGSELRIAEQLKYVCFVQVNSSIDLLHLFLQFIGTPYTQCVLFHYHQLVYRWLWELPKL